MEFFDLSKETHGRSTYFMVNTPGTVVLLSFYFAKLVQIPYISEVPTPLT